MQKPTIRHAAVEVEIEKLHKVASWATSRGECGGGRTARLRGRRRWQSSRRCAGETVRRMLDAGTAKPVTALVWRAGLSMRTCFKIQTFVMRLPARELLPARGGIGFPLERSRNDVAPRLFRGACLVRRRRRGQQAAVADMRHIAGLVPACQSPRNRASVRALAGAGLLLRELELGVGNAELEWARNDNSACSCAAQKRKRDRISADR